MVTYWNCIVRICWFCWLAAGTECQSQRSTRSQYELSYINKLMCLRARVCVCVRIKSNMLTAPHTHTQTNNFNGDRRRVRACIVFEPNANQVQTDWQTMQFDLIAAADNDDDRKAIFLSPSASLFRAISSALLLSLAAAAAIALLQSINFDSMCAIQVYFIVLVVTVIVIIIIDAFSPAFTVSLLSLYTLEFFVCLICCDCRRMRWPKINQIAWKLVAIFALDGIAVLFLIIARLRSKL